MRNRTLPRFVIRWPERCQWCGDPMYPGDEGSYSEDDGLVEYGCAVLEQP